MKKVLISGTFDILHAGHIQFFKEAKALGDYLIVTFCNSKLLKAYKGRESSMPDDNKKVLLESIRYIDKVYIGTDTLIFDFIEAIQLERPDILAVTEDDKNIESKKSLCELLGIELVVLKKDNPVTQISTTEIRNNILK